MPDPTPPTEAELRREDFLHYWADADNAVARAFVTDLDALLDAVRAEERERCAKVADVAALGQVVSATITAAIRAIREGGR